MNNSAKVSASSIPLIASEAMIFDFFSWCANLAFQLSWQPIKYSGLDKIRMFGRGLLKEQFCKTFVKISEVGA